MYSAKIENRNGEVLILTGNEPVYQVTNIEGLNPPLAQVNTTPLVGIDGAVFNSSKLETRNIVLTVKINGDVETNRLNLYRYFRTKEWCKFYYSNDSVNVSIVGYVESVECGLFTNNETAQISIICPYPYFRSLTDIVTDISHTLGLFTFPFSINIGQPIAFSSYDDTRMANVFNPSQAEIGMTIDILFTASASEVFILNETSGESMTLQYTFTAGDLVSVDTHKGQKSVTLMRDGEVSSIFGAVVPGSTFFQLAQGSNVFSYTIDGGADGVDITMTYAEEYRGV